MTDHLYQVVLLGRNDQHKPGIVAKLKQGFSDLGMDDRFYRILDGENLKIRDRKSAAAAIFLGFDGAVNESWPELDALIADTIPVLPVVDSTDNFSMKVPEALSPVNGIACHDDAGEQAVCSLIFENLALLRRERRLFISYRREDSSSAAEQLADNFTAHGFDCFLDTRSVRPSDNFQDELWHRMADSDVVVLLDTPNFRGSQWTVKELTQANSTSVQILHLLWPGVAPDPFSAFSVFHSLEMIDFRFVGRNLDRFSKLKDATVQTILERTESLRARAIAARQSDLFDSVADAANEVRVRPILHPQRYMTLHQGGRNLAIMPTVGVPSSQRLHSFLDILRREHTDFELIALFDERGILESWRQHLAWLSEHLPVKTVETGRLLNWLTSGGVRK